MRKGVKSVAIQKEHAVEQDDAPSRVEFTISFNPFPARVKPKAESLSHSLPKNAHSSPATNGALKLI